jgi:hypothetical protein
MYSRSRAVKLTDGEFALHSMARPIAQFGRAKQPSREMCDYDALMAGAPAWTALEHERINTLASG